MSSSEEHKSSSPWWGLITLLIVIVVGYAMWQRMLNPSTETVAPSSDVGMVVQKTEPTPAPSVPLPKALLTHVFGEVKVTHNAVEAAATEGQEVFKGDRVRTGADGQVSIEFYASDRAALDVNSDVTLDDATINATDWKKQQVSLSLVAGRVWSRALRLLDIDSQYQVSVGGIVSSVRGTAFLVTATGTQERVDEFEGKIFFSGKLKGELPEGLSAAFNPASPPQVLQTVVFFTPDEIRNDHWIRSQLRADKDFAARAAAVRKAAGVDEDISTIGNEAGPFTLDQPGVLHSGFRGVEVQNRDQNANISAGATVQLTALALLEVDGRVTQKDVSDQAIWAVSNPAEATVDAHGLLKISPQAQSLVQVIARWNDGTHEHSGLIQLRLK